MVAAMVGNHDESQPVAFGQSARYRQHDAVAEGHDCGTHVVVGIVPFGYGIGTGEERAFKILSHELQWNDDVWNVQHFAIDAGALDFACVVVGPIVESHRHCYAVFVLVQEGGGVHAAREYQYSVFHFMMVSRVSERGEQPGAHHLLVFVVSIVGKRIN